MADREKLLTELPGAASPEGQAGVPSKAETVESRPAVHEAPQSMTDHVSEAVPVMAPIVAAAPVAPVVVVKDEVTKEIEEILSEDLGDIYKNLPPEKKAQFRTEGEKTAGLIRQMIEKGKFHGRRALKLITSWLKLIPGVNKFFLEQESKIKTDKLYILVDEQKNKKV